MFPAGQSAYEISHDLQGGPARDMSAGIRLVSKLSAGVALCRWTTTSDMSVAIHDQNDFSTRFLDIGQRRFDHGHVAFHFPVAWTVQVADRFDIAILGGPSLFRVTHSPVTGIEAARDTTTASTSRSAGTSGWASGY